MRERSRRLTSSADTRVPRWRPPALIEMKTSATRTTATPAMISTRFFTARSGERGGHRHLEEHPQGPDGHGHGQGRAPRHPGGDAIADGQQRDAPDGEEIDAGEQGPDHGAGFVAGQETEVRHQVLSAL